MSLRIIAGKFKGRALKTPKAASTRPTQGMLREAIFNICQNDIAGARFLDLFAGSGAMGLEALSRGAGHATFIEQNRGAVQCIKENVAALHVETESAIIPMNFERALDLLTRQGAKFDLIYIDPPYDLRLDFSPVTPLITNEGTLFLEQRYDPKRSNLAEIKSLTLKDSRRFGSAQLSIFRL